MDSRLEIALNTSEQLLEGMELETITTSSAVMQCLRIARLLSDNAAIKWLQYELQGYARTEDGHIEATAFLTGWKMGRGYYLEKKQYIFIELAPELEQEIETLKLSIGSVTTNGASVAGDYALVAMSNLTGASLKHTSDIKNRIVQCQKNLAILRGKYYEYALKVNIELSFSKEIGKLFDTYREKVDLRLMGLIPASIQKLQAVYNGINSNNPEEWSQALTSCRRLFEDVSNALFSKYFPQYEEKEYKTKSGKELKITGDNYINRLYAIIDSIQDKAINNTLLGSHVLFTVDWIENLHNQICKGVHSDVTYEEAMRTILHCYICLGDILNIVSIE